MQQLLAGALLTQHVSLCRLTVRASSIVSYRLNQMQHMV